MKKHFRILTLLLNLCLQQDLEYRPNFVAAVILSLLGVSVPLIFFNAIYLQIDTIAGWIWSEMIILIGTFMIIDSIMMGLMISNMNALQSDILHGELDNILAMPIDSQFYVSVRSIDFPQLINVITGIVIVMIGIHSSRVQLSVEVLLAYLLFLLSGMIIYYCIWFIWTVGTFWWPNNESRNELFLSSISLSKMPDDIYKGMASLIFKFIFPFALIASPSSKLLIGKMNGVLILEVFMVSVMGLVLSRVIWKQGLKKYTSSGS